jgi:8-oxo-dGTP pyrophosphatase MutT (NUDIX family)
VANIAWAESYLGQLRALAGDRVLMFVGARTLVRDDSGRVLLIRRSDNGHWAMPAGAMELGESIAQCAARELIEESGLVARELVPIAMHTGVDYTFTNMFGDTYQLFITVFLVTSWTGDLVRVTDETTDAGFFDPAELPEPMFGSVAESLADLAEFERTGRLVLK